MILRNGIQGQPYVAQARKRCCTGNGKEDACHLDGPDQGREAIGGQPFLRLANVRGSEIVEGDSGSDVPAVCPYTGQRLPECYPQFPRYPVWLAKMLSSPIIHMILEPVLRSLSGCCVTAP